MNYKIEIILLQIDIIFGKPLENLKAVDKLLKKLDKQSNVNHTIVLLPELFTTGYDLSSIPGFAQSLKNHEAVIFLQDIAINKAIWIYTSIPERERQNIYNTGILINSKGDLVSKYQKIHLFDPLGEKQAFNSGTKTGKIEAPWGLTGLFICYDLRFPEQFIKLRNANAEIFLLVAEWPIQRIDHWVSLSVARAIENQAFLVGLNRVGTDPTGTYGGNSLVVSPSGEILAKLGSKPGMSSVVIDLEDVRIVRKVFRVKNDAEIVFT